MEWNKSRFEWWFQLSKESTSSKELKEFKEFVLKEHPKIWYKFETLIKHRL